MEIKTVSIIGLGALGILFGNHLLHRMPEDDLRIIADPDRIEKYQKEKVYCNGVPCNFHYISNSEECEPADLMIFAVKYSALGTAIKEAKNQIGKDTIIISLLNGITSESIISETFGMDNILYCVAQGMDAVKVGNKLTYHNMGMIVFGDEEPGIISEKSKILDDFFNKMGLPHEVEINMKKKLFSKFMFNVGVNQTVAVYEDSYGIVMNKGKARDTMIAAMREVKDISVKAGINLTEDDINYWLGVLDNLSPKGKPSLRQDLEAKRYSEVDLFSGTVIEFGQKYGVPTPVNQMLYDQIKEIESKF